MRPDLLPDGHSRFAARRVRIISGNAHLPRLRVDELLVAEAETEAANQNERDEMIVGFLLLGLLLVTFLAVGVAGFLIGRGA